MSHNRPISSDSSASNIDKPCNNKNKIKLSELKSHHFYLFKNNMEGSIRALGSYRLKYGNKPKLAGEENETLRDAIRLAEAASEYAKKLFLYGRGNVVEDAKKSNGLSYFYMMKKRCLTESKKGRKFLAKLKKPESEPLKRSIIHRYYSATTAYVAEGGNCGQYTAAAFTFAGELNKNPALKIVSCSHADDHAFFIIYDEKKEFFIVCDPWADFVGNVKTKADYNKKFPNPDKAIIAYYFYKDAVDALLNPFKESVVRLTPFQKVNFDQDGVEKKLKTMINDEQFLQSFSEEGSKKASQLYGYTIEFENLEQYKESVAAWPFENKKIFPKFYTSSKDLDEIHQNIYGGHSDSEEEQDLISPGSKASRKIK